jgi:cytochrome c-type biogenesis protein CcmF
MLTLGAASLITAFVLALFTVGAALYGARRDQRVVDVSRRTVYALFGLLALCVVILEAAFARTDLSLAVVADHSSTTTPLFYRFTAMWSSQEGSLMLWAFVLSGASSAVLLMTHRKHREIVPYATAVLGGLIAFFTGLMLFGANPFDRLNPPAVAGVGLEPLLRHPAMAVHPPMLYTGYALFSIPFAFAIGALVARRVDATWIRATRRFALVAWICLTVGIMLGARWSYSELGWGGYWGWDPVENASLMPWLVGTAFIHSIMVQEKRGMLKVWNVSLICATYSLALLGTFLVRSGILDSIHAFGASTVGAPLLGLIAVVVIGSAVLIASRLNDLRSEKRFDSLLSRESVFLVNNLLLVGLCVVIFWGTFFPLISEFFTGQKSSLAGPWFDRYTTPLAILLVLFTGIGPLLAWRKVSASSLWRVVRTPAIVAVGVVVVLAVFTDAANHGFALAMFGMAAFALSALTQEFWRGANAQRALGGGSLPRSLATVVGRNRRRYGGYIVHSGFAIALIAVAASSSFQTSSDLRLRPGQAAQVGSYRVKYVRPTQEIDSSENRLTLGAILSISKGGTHYTTLAPSRNYYASSTVTPGTGPIRGFFEGEATSEVGRKTEASGDIWTAMQPDLGPMEKEINADDAKLEALQKRVRLTPTQFANLQGLGIAAVAKSYMHHTPPAEFRVNVNPLVIWIWIGGAISVMGALIAIWPAPEARRRRVSDVYAARIARELGA